MDTWIDQDTGIVWWSYIDETLYQHAHIPEFEEDMEGFRVASIEEMFTILDFKKNGNMFKDGCPFPSDMLYWSSTANSANDGVLDHAWALDPMTGKVFQSARVNKRRILVCRGN